MATTCTVNITKQTVSHLDSAPLPQAAKLLHLRSGKVSLLGHEPSGIFKAQLSGKVYISETGISSDEHVYHTHGGTERALHQYASEHYPSWRTEAPHPELFAQGGFGENIVGTGMNEENVCIGDVYRIGAEVIVQVSEPRSPCSKLNVRFDWPRALKRVQRTGRVGWNFRVLRTGYVSDGDGFELLRRPNPCWSVMNVKRVIQGRSALLGLLRELADLEVLTEQIRGYARDRLYSLKKDYRLVETRYVTNRVKELTFELVGDKISKPHFRPFAFAQIEFPGFTRSYSIVAGDLNRFKLGVALDEHSRGGSAYLHQKLEVGDEITMAPGSSPKAEEDEEKCITEDCVRKRLVVIGGIGVTAFLPHIKEWIHEGVPFEVHYAVRSPEDAAYSDRMGEKHTRLYAKSRQERLRLEDVILKPKDGENFATKIYCCGPQRLMDACKELTQKLGFPDHMVRFESFGSDAGGPRGDPFEVHVDDIETGRSEDIKVPAEKTLLMALRDAGFDMTSFCEMGGCGACKVQLCKGDIDRVGDGLKPSELKAGGMLSCVDRGRGKIAIELD